MPHPGSGFPIPPFQWPHVGRQWPAYNVESDQADGLVMWMPYGGAYPGSHQHVDLVGGFVFTEGGTPTWVFDGERGWAILLDDAASEYLAVNSVVVSAPPFALMARIYNDDLTEADAIIEIGEPNATDAFRLQVAGQAAGDYVRFAATQGGAAAWATTTTGATINTWHHVCALAAAADDRSIYIDADSKGTSSVSKTPGAMTHTAIGVRGTLSSGYFSGRIDDVRIYNRIFTDTEVEQFVHPDTEWELFQIPQRLWRLGAVAPPPPTAALPIFPPPDAIHSQVFGGVTVR